jgi:RNA-directed DNA polymerase
MSIANHKRSTLSGWLNYYSKYGRSGILKALSFLDREVVRWAKRKYKRLTSKRKSRHWFLGVRRREPIMFVHWEFANMKMIGR